MIAVNAIFNKNVVIDLPPAANWLVREWSGYQDFA